MLAPKKCLRTLKMIEQNVLSEKLDLKRSFWWGYQAERGWFYAGSLMSLWPKRGMVESLMWGRQWRLLKPSVRGITSTSSCFQNLTCNLVHDEWSLLGQVGKSVYCHCGTDRYSGELWQLCISEMRGKSLCNVVKIHLRWLKSIQRL